MIVAMASLKSREGADEGELERTFERMRELVATIPGFLSYKNYVAEDGEELEVVRFESEAALESWRIRSTWRPSGGAGMSFSTSTGCRSAPRSASIDSSGDRDT